MGPRVDVVFIVSVVMFSDLPFSHFASTGSIASKAPIVLESHVFKQVLLVSNHYSSSPLPFRVCSVVSDAFFLFPSASLSQLARRNARRKVTTSRAAETPYVFFSRSHTDLLLLGPLISVLLDSPALSTSATHFWLRTPYYTIILWH